LVFDHPAGGVLVPAHVGDTVWKAAPRVQVEMPADARRVLEDLGRLGVLAAGM
jgi:hypothetical protein